MCDLPHNLYKDDTFKPETLAAKAWRAASMDTVDNIAAFKSAQAKPLKLKVFQQYPGNSNKVDILPALKDEDVN